VVTQRIANPCTPVRFRARPPRSQSSLTGTVDSREAKRRAEDCVESVSGVKNVQNNLRVQAASEDESTRTTTGGKKNKAGGDGEQRIQ
jgi:hypothetical protein